MHVAIVAAHPDDETIGASALLTARAEITVIHVTNGAPRNARWWPKGVRDRDRYARDRDREARRALSIVGAARIALGFEDQTVVYGLVEVAEAIADALAYVQPDAIVSHAYEGGHPDHDAVACCVATAAAHVAPAVRRFEMALYHGASASLQVGQFLGAPGRRRVLSTEERAHKTAMLAQYRSQHATLAPFASLLHECYRCAPVYDFTRPPHDGPLHYERVGMGPTGVEWRALVTRFLQRSPDSFR